MEKNATAGQAAVSGRYRAAMAEAMLQARNTVLVAQIGHGTVLAAISAASAAHVKDLLLIVPKPMAETVTAQLENAGIPVTGSCIGQKKGSAADMCRAALRARTSPDTGLPRVWLAAPNQAAEIGNWHDAWKNTFTAGAPFGMIFVFDGHSFANSKSERGRGMRIAAGYADRAVMFLDEDKINPDDVIALSENFGTVVHPMLARRAANACEAMCMDN